MQAPTPPPPLLYIRYTVQTGHSISRHSSFNMFVEYVIWYVYSAAEMCSIMNAMARSNDAAPRTASSTKDVFLHYQPISCIWAGPLFSFLFFSSLFCAFAPGTISKANNKLPSAVTSARASRTSVSCDDNCLYGAAHPWLDDESPASLPEITSSYDWVVTLKMSDGAPHILNLIYES